MRTIAIINLKGGTAKTTTTVNLAAELRHRGKRVLCIDADPQHNLTDFLGASADGTTITDLLAGRVCEADIAVQRLGAGFGIVPSDLSLCEIDIEAIQKGISLRTVRDLCEAVADDFDVCLIDCPPSFTAASIAALVAADEVILPVTVDAFAIGGAQEIVQQVENLATVNPALRVRGVLVTMWQRTSVCMQGEDAVRRLAELAFGRANDAVAMALSPEREGLSAEKLDLSAVSEFKVTDKGGVEVKLIDRIRALEALYGLLSEEKAEGAGELYRVLTEAAGEEGGWDDG